MNKSYFVKYKKDGEVRGEWVEARNNGAAVEKIKKERRTTKILEINKTRRYERDMPYQPLLLLLPPFFRRGGLKK